MLFTPAGSHLLSGVGARSVQLWPLLLSTVSPTSFSQVFCELSQFPDVRGTWSREGGHHRTFHLAHPAPSTAALLAPWAANTCLPSGPAGKSQPHFGARDFRLESVLSRCLLNKGKEAAPKSSSSLLRKPFIVLILLLLF